MPIFKDPKKVKFEEDLDAVLQIIEETDGQNDHELQQLLRGIIEQGLDEDDQFKKEQVKDKLFRDSFRLENLRPELFPANNVKRAI